MLKWDYAIDLKSAGRRPRLPVRNAEMGLRNRSIITNPSLFFVTSTIKQWRPLFENPIKRDTFESLLFSLIPSHADALMGYVIMPDHIHLLVGCANGGNQLSKFMQTLKSLSARKLFPGIGTIWERRFDDLVIHSDKQYRTKLNYLHENPVRRGLVGEPTDWRWSSARFWMTECIHPVLTKEWNWMEK
jgi:putative transposase